MVSTLFERPEGGERAVLVHLDLSSEPEREDIVEFHDLAVSAGVDPITVVTGSRATPDPRLFVGSGKAEEIAELIAADEVEVVLFNHALSPTQERNLEAVLKCRVLDRTGLILDIFAQRAQSHEGKLQVELAQLRHLSTRLVRGWTHLERQKGGIGLRGPGETQLETDRRLLGERIKQLQRRLEKVRRSRGQGRRARQRNEIETVSLVGYTNAGKSTLFNTLTEAEVYAADRLFATLDPTLRRYELSPGRAVILADTVGFVRHLPHELVEAFRSTLDETREAGLLLHVVDAADDERRNRIDEVNEVLEAIGADAVPQLLVYNKIDLIDPPPKPRIERDDEGLPVRVWLSAQKAEGLALLAEAVAELVGDHRVQRRYVLPPSAGKQRALLFEHARILGESFGEAGEWLLDVEFSDASVEQQLMRQGLSEDWKA